MSDWINIKDRVYIVTGASSGIGASIATELLKVGAKVIDADLNPSKIKNNNFIFIKTDVTKKDQVDRLVQKVVDKFNKIDGVVNVAGIDIPGLLVDAEHPDSKYTIKEDVFDKMFNVNVKSIYLVSQAVGKHLVKNEKGVIINMSSVSGLDGSQGQSIYAATKGAIDGLTNSWAKELGKYNIRVIGVAPGIMEATGLRTNAYEEALAYTRGITVDQLRKGYKSRLTVPLGRSGKLSEVADLVTYLLSDKASYLTGLTVSISGGKSRG